MENNFQNNEQVSRAHKLIEAGDFDSYKELLELADGNLWVVKQQILRFGNMALSAAESTKRSQNGPNWYRIGVSNASAACTVDVQPLFNDNLNEGLVFVNVYNGQFERISDNLAVISNQREDHTRTLIQYQIPDTQDIDI